MADVTQILSQIESGDPSAADQLLPLVHEAWLKLVDVDEAHRWDSRGPFFAAAAEAMRRILINRARDKRRLKRGGDRERVHFDLLADPATAPDDDLLELDDALSDLAGTNPQAAELVKLRYFAGLPLPEAAAILGLSTRSAARLWAFARAWLIDALDHS